MLRGWCGDVEDGNLGWGPFSCDEDGKDHQPSKKLMDREQEQAPAQGSVGSRRQAVDPTGTPAGRGAPQGQSTPGL